MSHVHKNSIIFQRNTRIAFIVDVKEVNSVSKTAILRTMISSGQSIRESGVQNEIYVNILNLNVIMNY